MFAWSRVHVPKDCKVVPQNILEERGYSSSSFHFIFCHKCEVICSINLFFFFCSTIWIFPWLAIWSVHSNGPEANSERSWTRHNFHIEEEKVRKQSTGEKSSWRTNFNPNARPVLIRIRFPKASRRWDRNKVLIVYVCQIVVNGCFRLHKIVFLEITIRWHIRRKKKLMCVPNDSIE